MSGMFRYLFLPTDTPISIPVEMIKFKCVILVEREVSNDYRNQVSDDLVKAGCLYSLAWGLDCSLWDDSVDWAFLELYNYSEYPEEKFVMTTWHEGQTLQETLEFARHCTKYSDVKLEDVLVLDFGNQERGAEIEKIYQNT